jgi:hypothetical protein
MHTITVYGKGDKVQVETEGRWVGTVTDSVMNFAGERWYWVDAKGPYQRTELKPAARNSAPCRVA